MAAMLKLSPAVGLMALINEALELGVWSFFLQR
jgi:hypothetical protein